MTFISYAQNFEDVRLWRAFADVGVGRYIDIGAQDPVKDSVSLAFYERGWRGVHVEPTSAYAAMMRVARPDETVIEAAVSMAQGPLLFFEIPKTGLSTGDPEIAEQHKDSGWECREIFVPTVTLADILDLSGPDLINWMKIDVEGMEADVLASWGDCPARPAALVIEATSPGTQKATHQAWYEMVTGRGYIDVLFDGLSRYFVHESHASRGEALALSPNIFDGYQVAQSHFSASHLTRNNEAELSAMRKEAEEERVREVTALSERLAEAQAAAGLVSEQLGATQEEVARLHQQALEDTEAHIKMKERAQTAAAAAEAALEAAREKLSTLEAHSDELARSQAIALCIAQDAAATNERALAEAYARFDALQQAHRSLVRENGQLEGRIAAQDEAYTARLADDATVRQELAGRVSRVQQAHHRAQSDLAVFRAETAFVVRRYKDDLASAANRYSIEAQAAKQAEAECDRLREVVAHGELQLAEQITLKDALAARRSQHEAEFDTLIAELESVRQQGVAQALAFNDRRAQLEHRIEWLEHQLQAATALIDQIPRPLAGVPRVLAALVRPTIRRAELAAITKHQTALDNFRRDLLLPPASEVSHEAQIPPVNQPHAGLIGIEQRGVPKMESDELVTSVPRLLAPHDQEFIQTAYQAVLGRAPDPEGEAYYLARLRAGTQKLAILKQLRRSAEGQNFIPGVAGLDRAIKRHVWTTLPILGALLRLLWGTEGDGATHRALRIVANDVGRLGAGQGRIHAEHSALVVAMQELACSAIARPQASLASSTIGPQPEATPVNSSGAREQGIEPPSPNLGQHASRLYDLLAKSLQMQQTQGAD